MKTKQFCKKSFSIVLAYVFLFANSGFAQMIVTDGRTDTTVTQNGSIYDINTSTVSGNTGFNSFSKFDVYENTTANMHLPEGTANLVNLVNGPQSNINGVLNSYKNGQIGGNVFFLNPNGIMIGANGIVNVGSLTLMTPTKEFMQSVLNEDKTASQTATKAILAGDLPIDSRGLISVKGKIKALGGVGMIGGSVRNDGQINTNFQTSDIVNTAGIKESGVFVENGQIVIKAQENFVNTGVISADVKNTNDGAEIDVRAKNISIESGTISANAQGGKGGKIVVFADENANFEQGALISAKSQENDGGFIELSAKNEVVLNGGEFAASGAAGKQKGKVYIDPENITISQDVFTHGADYEVEADNRLTVNENIYIVTAVDAGESGDSGNISLKGSNIDIKDDARIWAAVSDTNKEAGYKAGNVSIKAKNKSKDFSGESSAEVNIGKSVLIEGKDITISAEAETENPFDKDENLETLREKIAYKILKELSDDQIKIVYLDTSANAKVNIDEGTVISSDGDMEISANAKVESKVKLKDAKVSAVAVISDAESAITIAENTTLDSKGDITISAESTNKVKISTKAVSKKKENNNGGNNGGNNSGNNNNNNNDNNSGDNNNNNDNNDSGDDPAPSAGNDNNNDNNDNNDSGDDPAPSAVNDNDNNDNNEDNNNDSDNNNNNNNNSNNNNDSEEGGDNFSIAVAYSQLKGETKVNIGKNTDLNADGEVSVKTDAKIENDLSASTESKDKSFAGISVAIGLSEVESNILMDGNITAKNVEISSSLNSEGLSIGADSGVGNKKKKKDNNNGSNNNDSNDNDNNDSGDDPAPSAGDNDGSDDSDDDAAPTADMDLDAKTDNVEKNLQDKKSNENSGVKFAMGGAVTWIDYDNKATAKIGSNANITSADDVKVEASLSHEGIRQSAGACIDSNKDTTIENALAAAINVGIHEGTAIAGIEDGANINLGGTLDVNASYEVPYEPTWWEVFETKDPEKIYKDLKEKWEDENKGIQDGFVSVFSQSGISDDQGEDSDDNKGTNIGIAGTVHITDWTQNVNAYIGAANINQNIPDSASQKVNVSASSEVQLVSLGGMWSLGISGNVDGDKGIGASYIQNWYESDVKAEIKDGAKINTSALSVNSELDQIDVTIGLANAESKTFGFEGVFNWLDAENEVKASISKNADITVRGDNEDDKLSVTANDNSNFINIAGSVLRGENTGVGASVAITDLEKNTHAYIGDDIKGGVSAATGSFTVDTDAEIEATNEGNVIGLTLAGAVSKAENKQEENDAEGDNGKFGIGISGDVVYSNVDTQALAYANNVVYNGEGEVSFNAEDSHSIYNVAGSLGIGMGGETASVGIAGAATAAKISNGTIAEILNSNFNQIGDVSLDANSYSNVVTAAVSGSGATGEGVNVAVAGSVSVNQFKNDIKAAVVNSEINSDNLDVNAENDSKITAVTGAFEYAGGNSTSVGVGASVTYNKIDNTTKAFAQDSEITLAQKATFTAQDKSRITAVAGTAGVSTGLLSVEASLSINEISNDVLSYTEGSNIISIDDTQILAKNYSSMTVVAGQISIAGKIAVGASAATSKIRNNTKAYAENAGIEAKNVLIYSDSSTDITTSAAGVAASKGSVAVAGSVAVNDIDTETSAFTKASNILAQGSIGLLSTVHNDVAFYGGNLAGSSSVGVGATISVNVLRDRAYSYVQDSTLDALGNDYLALNGKTIKGLGVNTYLDDSFYEIIINGALGIEAAGIAGTVDVNTISNEAQAYIANSNVNKVNDSATDEQQVDVYANNKISSEVYGGSLGISVSGAGIGGVSETAVINNNTYSGIKQNSIVNAKKSVNVETLSTEDYDSIMVAGGASGQVGIAGAVNVAIMDGTNLAEISESSVYSEEDVSVKAKDEANLGKNNSVSVGSAGIGIGIAGIGGSVLVTNNKNETTAQIVSSTVDAEKDLKVRADSISSLRGYVPTGGAGLYAGIAASVAVNTINTQANALVSGSNINQSAFSKTEKAQNVEVSAESETNLDNVVASLGAGFVGVGAAVAVNNIHNSAQAGILNGSNVYSTGDILVEAKSDKDTSSVVAALGGGVVGLSGSVSVLNIGGATDKEAMSNISEAANVANTELGRNKNMSADNLGNGGYFADTVDVVKENSNVNVTEELSESLKRAQGTSAFVDHSSLMSKGSSKINAEDNVKYNNIAGGTSLGIAAAVGASVATANIESTTSAFVGDNSTITAGKDIDVNALSKVSGSKLLAFMGSGSLYGSLSAVAAVADEETNAVVTIGKGATLSADEDINLTSKTASDTHTQTVGVAVGAAAIGVSVSKITKGGESGVLLDDGANVWGRTNAVATTNDDNYAEAEAGSGGIYAGEGSIAIVENNDKVYAKTGKNVKADGVGFSLTTDGNIAAKTKNIGVSLGAVAVGVGNGKTIINLDNKVEVGEGTDINTGYVYVFANQNKTEVRSDATGVTGALVGGTGTKLVNKITGNVTTQVKDDSSLVGETVTVGSSLNTDQESEAKYASASAAGVGGNVVDIYNNVSTITELGNGLNMRGGLLMIVAYSNNRSYANVQSGSGGLLDVAVGAAKTENDNTAKVLIGKAGSDKVNRIEASYMSILSDLINTQDAKIDMMSVGGITGSGMSNTNNSTQNVLIDFEGINNVIADDISISAHNTFKKDIVKDQNMYYRGAGGVQISVGKSTTNIKDNTDVIFGDNTSLLAKNEQSYASMVVNAFNNLQAKDYIKLNAGALIEAPMLTTTITNDGHADITIGKASLTSYGKSIFNTKTDVDFNATTNMSIYGAAGVAHGVAVVDSTNKNNVTLKDGANLFSLKDTQIGLTQPINTWNIYGEPAYPRAKVNLLAKTQIWNNTAVPVSANSYAEVNHTTTDKVNINEGAMLKSGTNVVINTDTPIEKSEGIFDYVSYLGAVAASNKTAHVNSSYYSSINNNGTILAGAGNKQYITIKNKDDGSLDVNVSDPEGLVYYNETEENLVNNLITEIERYESLKQQYSASDPLALGYQAEIDRLMQELRDLQLVETVVDPVSDETVEFVKKVSDVKFITFDNLAANHGDIKINANDLNGTGILEARGSSVLSLINDSDHFLRVSDVKINDNALGGIYYNSFSVATPEEIRDINLREKNVKFSSDNVRSDLGKGMESLLLISSNYVADGLGINTELNGDIENLAGKVKINTTGSLYAKHNIRANEIELSANKDIVQYMVEGFRHLGGDPAKQWSSIAGAHEASKTNANTNEVSDEANRSSIIANNIFISGRYLNLNGLVQSGTADYKLNIDDENIVLRDFANIELAKADYQQKVTNNDMVRSPLYKLDDKYGSIAAYYNVLTDNIEVNDIQVEGGHMELLGHIMNTSTQGNGELRVLDGYGQVDIVNNSAHDIVINSLDTSNKVKGYLKITDLAQIDPSGKALVTIYEKVGDTVREVNSMTRDENGNPNNVVTTDASVYNPLAGQRYKWMTGQETLVKNHYYRESSSFWGIDYEDLSDYTKSTINVDPTPLEEGSLLILDDTANPNTYSYTYQDLTIGSPVKTLDKTWTTSSGWWIFSTKTYHHELEYETGHKNYNTHSIKADNPIKINFGGYDNGNINIVSNNSNVLLNGVFNNVTGNVNITSTNHGIDNIGLANIIAKDINLSAKTDIGKYEAIPTSLTGGALSAIAEQGDINLINVDPVLKINNISADKGEVILNSNGNIINNDANSLIAAKELKLFANEIGTQYDALNISAGKITAYTVKDMNLNQTGGNLGIYTMNSERGNITVTASDNVYDATEEGMADTRTLEDKRKDWEDMDLFGEAGWKEDQLVYAVGFNSGNIDYDIDTTTAVPSVTASKITINAGGAVGVRSQDTVIDVSDNHVLTEEEKHIIAMTPSAHMKINKDNQTVTVHDNKPIVLKGDIVNVEAQDGIYLRQTADNLESDYIRNNNSGEVRLEVPTSNIEIRDLKVQDGGLHLVFGKDWHSLAYLLNKDIKKMTINPTAAIIPEDDEIIMPSMTINNNLDSVANIQDFDMNSIVRTMDNLQSSVKKEDKEDKI